MRKVRSSWEERFQTYVLVEQLVTILIRLRKAVRILMKMIWLICVLVIASFIRIRETMLRY